MYYRHAVLTGTKGLSRSDPDQFYACLLGSRIGGHARGFMSLVLFYLVGDRISQTAL
jgi:hypothetical protein